MQLLWRNSTNSPFLSGDSIAQLCDLTVSRKSISSMNYQDLVISRSIFIEGDLFESFMSQYKDELTAEVLVVGNSDVNFVSWPELPPSVNLFIAQNAGYQLTDRFRILPIGLENLRLGRLGSPKWYYERESFIFEDKVLVPPMSPTNEIRRTVLDSPDLNDRLFHVFREYLDERKYFDLVGRYRFILALEGNGFENHRVWESLYQNSFPVMLKTPWSMNIASLGLPVLLIDSISQISSATLQRHLRENAGFSAAKCDVLWVKYWESLICPGGASLSR